MNLDQTDPEQRELRRRFARRALRHYAAVALIVAAALAINGKASDAIYLAGVAVALFVASFRVLR